MSKENEIDVSLVERHIQKFDQLNRLTEFFFTHTAKAIGTNAKQLNFWHEAILKTDLMDDPEHRKEFQRIVDMVQHLAVLASQFNKQDILSLISFIEENQERARRILFSAKYPELIKEVPSEEMEVRHG